MLGTNGHPLTGTARYSGEFKRDTIALMESSERRIPSAARELGVNAESLRLWVARSRTVAVTSGPGGGGPLTPTEREELRRLRERRSVGWSLAGHMRAELVVAAVQAAVDARGGGASGVAFNCPASAGARR